MAAMPATPIGLLMQSRVASTQTNGKAAGLVLLLSVCGLAWALTYFINKR
jgi:hypothetical protein